MTTPDPDTLELAGLLVELTRDRVLPEGGLERPAMHPHLWTARAYALLILVPEGTRFTDAGQREVRSQLAEMLRQSQKAWIHSRTEYLEPLTTWAFATDRIQGSDVGSHVFFFLRGAWVDGRLEAVHDGGRRVVVRTDAGKAHSFFRHDELYRPGRQGRSKRQLFPGTTAAAQAQLENHLSQGTHG